MKEHKRILRYTIVLMCVVITILTSCEKESGNSDNSNLPPILKIPELTTTEVSDIATKSVTCGGIISTNGGAMITSKGVCWSVNKNPTIEDNKSISSSNTDNFTNIVQGLFHNTTYFIRAFASNSVGTGYGNEFFFITLDFPYGSVNDIDGNTYKTIDIGSQTWMAENLKTTRYNDGTDITLITDNENWSNMISEGYCWFNNNEMAKEVFGALYNWEAVDTDKLCPPGWHVPTNDEWAILTNYLGGIDSAGRKLKEIGTAWYPYNSGTINETGFSGLPGGLRNWNGEFGYMYLYGNWWSSTQYNSDYAIYRGLGYDFDRVDSTYSTKEVGFSVRCLKD